MSWKLGVLFCLVVLALGCVLAAPRAINNDRDLTEAFSEFLKQDKELSAALEKLTQSGNLIRQRRDADISVEGVDGNGADEDGKPGFFDRAAKFVVELLQKFLRWINSDSN